MKAPRPLPLILFRTGLVAGAGILVSGCVSAAFKEAKIDPASPVAADVARITSASASYPSFKDIPAKSTDGRPIAAYGKAAKDLDLAAAQIEADTAPGTWTLQNSEAFAETARREVGPDLPPVTPGSTDDYVKALRERATPPPRPRR